MAGLARQAEIMAVKAASLLKTGIVRGKTAVSGKMQIVGVPEKGF